MVVNGQPKSMAEYIQATSRVGREWTPGLIITCYNAGRPRDRSHYETFRGWHQALYRDVEASSVTPFASRARDRALHAPLVAMMRHTVARFNGSPVLDPSATGELDALIDLIVARAAKVDWPERVAVRNELRAFADRWSRWSGLTDYWRDKADGHCSFQPSTLPGLPQRGRLLVGVQTNSREHAQCRTVSDRSVEGAPLGRHRVRGRESWHLGLAKLEGCAEAVSSVHPDPERSWILGRAEGRRSPALSPAWKLGTRPRCQAGGA